MVSTGALSRMCPIPSCTALGEQPLFTPHTTVADPEQGRLAGGQLHPAPSKVDACFHLLGNNSAAEKVLHLLKRIGRKRRMRFCYACAHTVRQLCSTGSPGAQVWGDRLVLRSSHSLQIMIKLSLFVGWRNMTCLNFLRSLHLIPRKGVPWYCLSACYVHHPTTLCLSCNFTLKLFSTFPNF